MGKCQAPHANREPLFNAIVEGELVLPCTGQM